MRENKAAPSTCYVPSTQNRGASRGREEPPLALRTDAGIWVEGETELRRSFEGSGWLRLTLGRAARHGEGQSRTVGTQVLEEGSLKVGPAGLMG